MLTKVGRSSPNSLRDSVSEMLPNFEDLRGFLLFQVWQGGMHRAVRLRRAAGARELAGNAARDKKRSRVTPRHIERDRGAARRRILEVPREPPPGAGGWGRVGWGDDGSAGSKSPLFSWTAFALGVDY